MAYAFQNTFEGGTNGTALTTANSGGTSGDALSFVVLGTGGGVQFNTLPWGGKGAVISNGSTATYLRWDDSSVTSGDTRRVCRRPVWLDAELGGTTNLAIIYTGGTAMGALTLVGPGANVRKLALQNGSFVHQGASQSSVVLSLNHLYWVEFAVRSTSHGSGAGLEYRLLDSDGTTQLATYDLAIATNAAVPDRVRFGSNTSTNIATDYLDDIRFEAKSSGWLGPLAATPPTIGLTSTVRHLIDARTSSVPIGTVDYSIAQLSGPTTAPEGFGAGVWAVTPHATETLTFEVTVSGSLGGSDSQTVDVLPLGVGTGTSSPVVRLRRVAGTWT